MMKKKRNEDNLLKRLRGIAQLMNTGDQYPILASVAIAPSGDFFLCGVKRLLGDFDHEDVEDSEEEESVEATDRMDSDALSDQEEGELYSLLTAKQRSSKKTVKKKRMSYVG